MSCSLPTFRFSGALSSREHLPGKGSNSDFRILMTTFRVTQLRRSGLPACGDSAPNAESVRVGKQWIVVREPPRMFLYGAGDPGADCLRRGSKQSGCPKQSIARNAGKAVHGPALAPGCARWLCGWHHRAAWWQHAGRCCGSVK